MMFLYTKSIIDGFTSIILTTTLGIGVFFSAIPVMLYQGLIALFATQIDRFVPQMLMDQFIVEMTATGGIMIFAIGLNLTGIIKNKGSQPSPWYFGNRNYCYNPLLLSTIFLIIYNISK